MAKSIPELPEQVMQAWKRHDEILRHLLENVPRGGLAAVPSESRGRTVAAQFYHLYRARLGWVGRHRTGKTPKVERFDKKHPPNKAELKKKLRSSAREMEQLFTDMLAGKVQPRFFGGRPVMFLGYLIAHESHHRGQIILALKQAGKPLPKNVAEFGMWGKWIFGK